MTEDLWYKNAVIYSLDLETFMDANSDGSGDFEGLALRLDYLHALGVDAIWVAPFQPSPNKDNGYDVSDYYGVDPRHGSSGNFVEFMHQAKKRGIKIIVDLVVNHTSNEHPWFLNARSDKHAKYRDWYVWSEKKPAGWDEGIVFPGVQKSTWTWDKKARAYYHHRFQSFQPDLNMDNPDVRAEIRRIMGYWLEMGIEGFRVDAVPFILETQKPGKPDEKIRFEYLREMRRFLQWRKGNAILLGEANVLPQDSNKYFGDEGNGIHMMFNFYVNQYVFYALATADIAPLLEALEATRLTYQTSQWVHFLRNHDELDLARLTEEQREKVFTRFAPEENMRLYERGIRRRLASMIANRPQMELAYSLLFSLPGTPVIRYGDEIGMGENLSLEERNSVRTPMQWSANKNAGFSTADQLVHPVIDKGPFSFDMLNVETQRRSPQSLLNWMTSLIRLRHECTEIGWGDWYMLETGSPTVLGIYYTRQGSSLITLHNFDEKVQEIMIDLKERKESKLIDLMNIDENVADENGRHWIRIEAYGYRWFRANDWSHLFQKKQT
jgi:maltose alpha-D-glucosyltransferase/alpha-amylase